MATVGRGGLTWLALVAGVACTSPRSDAPADDEYSFEAVVFERSKEGTAHSATLGPIEIVLWDPDSLQEPTAWEGPLEVRHPSSGQSCMADVSLITRVWVDDARTSAIVLSYSGSTTLVDVVDTGTCAVKWPQIEAVTDQVSVSGSRLSLLPYCEGDPPRSRCWAAQVFRLLRDEPPAKLEAESQQLTRATIGVEFVGEAWVEFPKTSSARLLDP
jgi:hypothetical protein